MMENPEILEMSCDNKVCERKSGLITSNNCVTVDVCFYRISACFTIQKPDILFDLKLNSFFRA